MTETNKSAPPEYPEILADLADRVAEKLIAKGLKPEDAGRIAWDVAEDVRVHWGGMQLYIGKGRSYILSARDLEIWNKWNGRNVLDLCREYDISLQRLYQILAAMREQEVARRQLKLLPD